MSFWVHAIIILVVLTNLKLLGSSRLLACIRIVAVQGILLGLLPVLAHTEGTLARLVAQSAASTLLKGVVFPWLLVRAVREADVRREVQPLVGFTMSLLAGTVLLAVGLWLGSRLPSPQPELPGSGILVGAALFTLMVGLFLIVSRKTALMQVLGYLAMENGIYAFGMAFAQDQPLLVELGILLDVFMAVFVMGIAIHHINREFDHIDTERLSTLRDS